MFPVREGKRSESMNIKKYVDCAVFQEHIYAFQSGDLSREDHTLLQQHCDDCESCVHLLEVEASFLRALQTRLRPDPAPAELKARIRAELESRTTQRPKVFSWLMSPIDANLETLSNAVSRCEGGSIWGAAQC